ncbi:hypothetical protein BDW02DRAFT_583095 [Decorospora gaudefroyi]|uniref:Uncharacterized protein n=1 Tax=Decorospora gaudefroyi TaxID=184978 RepID=A0A6A5K6P3_9PLEO|nr:hypothetical protein BDW02DRAFT_583095 [Decorospora gaudefroyi]
MWPSNSKHGSNPNSSSTTGPGAASMYTSTSVSETTPAPSTNAVAAAQVATQMTGAYPTRPSTTRLPSDADRPRGHVPATLTRTPTAASAVGKKPRPTQDHFDGANGDIESYGDHRFGGHDPHKPPPQYDRGPKPGNLNDELAYGDDPRGHHNKEKYGGGHMLVNKFTKRFKSQSMNESYRDTRTDQTGESDRERYKRERNEWKRSCGEYEEAYKQCLSVNNQLSENLAKEQDRVDRTKRSADLLEAAMDNKDVFLGAQARNDDEVRGRFGSILSSIKTWSNNFNVGRGHSFKEEMLPEYQRVAPLCTKLQILEQTVMDKKRKRLFVRGWAAYIMSKTLFRTLDALGDLGKDVWMEKGVADTFARLENELWFSDRKQITHRAFNDWRAFTADLVSKTLSSQKAVSENAGQAIQNGLEAVMAVVTPWCVTSDHEALRSHQDRLYKIFAEAVQLAQFLRCQRALWSIRFPSRPILPGLQETGPLMFDPSCMKDDRGDDEDMHPEQLRQRYVDIVVMPALYKRGNTNGEKFESEEAAVPAVVGMA